MASEETAALDEIPVPMKPRIYRGYRNINAFAAVFIAVLFVMLCCAGYSPLHKGFAIPPSTGWLGCLFFFLFYGTASGMIRFSSGRK